MIRTRIAPVLAVAAAAALGATAAGGPPDRTAASAPSGATHAGSASAAGSADWPAFQRNPRHTSAIHTQPAITTLNAGSLRPRWSFTAPAATRPGQPGAGFDATPVVVAGRLYIGSRTGMLSVLDAATGALVWHRQLDYGSSSVCAAKGIFGTATVKPDPVDHVLTVYAPGAHYLYALNAATGALRWRTAIGPDTTEGASLYLNWSSPTVSGGRIFMGLAASCERQDRLIRGGVVSLSQHTGAVQHTWYDVPEGTVGGSVWSSEAADGTSVWATTGDPDANGTSIDDTYSIVRLSAATLARTDRWTVPVSQASDLDFGASPSLFDGVVDGVSTPLVGACNKNGVYYAWKRSDLAAGPVWSRQVGASSSSVACLTSAAYEYTTPRLFVAANATTVAGTAVPGSVRALDPGTGALAWEQPLPCTPVGSPTLNGSVLAVPMYGCPAGVQPSVQFFDEADGTPVGSVPETGRTFGQVVFAAGQAFVAGEDGTLVAYGP